MRVNPLILVVYYLGTGLTVCYTFRLIYYRLAAGRGLAGLRAAGEGSGEAPRSLGALGLGAVVGGGVLGWL